MKNFIRSIIALIFLSVPVGLYADNYQPGNGPHPKTFATDSIGGVEYPRSKIVHGADGAANEITADNPFPTTGSPDNLISTSNSRAAATLAAAAVFQGTVEDVSKHGRAGVSVNSDNATDGVLTIEISHDGVTWGEKTRAWANTSTSQPHMWNIVEKYFRIKYTNGSTEAQNLSIQTQYSSNAGIILGHQLDETLINETEALVTRSVVSGQDNTDGVYRNVEVDRDGHLGVVAHAHPESGHALFRKTFIATEDVILIDVSDTTSYPHDFTTWVHTGNVKIDIAGSADADYVVKLGFLENVDATNGDFYEIFEVDGSRKAGNSHSIVVSASPESPRLRASSFVGPISLNDTAFQTDVNLRSTLDPTGTVATPSGSGDMVMRVTHTDGAYTVSMLVGYHSHE